MNKKQLSLTLNDEILNPIGAPNISNNHHESVDVVDFIKSEICKPCAPTEPLSEKTTEKQLNNNNSNNNNNTINRKLISGCLYGDLEVRSRVKSSFSTLEKLPIFHFQRKKSAPSSYHTSGTSANVSGVDGNSASVTKDRPKFVKSASIARLLGNTYTTTRPEELPAALTAKPPIKNSTERFQKKSLENEVDSEVSYNSVDDSEERGIRAFKSISKGISKLLWKKSYSVDISEPDPEFKVFYLGNVLTGWAKGKDEKITHF